MPDWTYQTVFRPVLFSMGARNGRRIALGFMGSLSRFPFGRLVIQLMGHMHPDARLAVEINGLNFPTRVGLGYLFDSDQLSTPALAEFGFGFLEIGPIVRNPVDIGGDIQLHAENETIRFERPLLALTAMATRKRLQRDGPYRLPIFARIEPSSADEAQEIFDVLSGYFNGFVVPLEKLENVYDQMSRSPDRRCILLAAVDAHTWHDDTCRERCLQASREGWLAGVIVGVAANEHTVQEIGKARMPEALEIVRLVRTELGAERIVIGSVGIHSPADALDYPSAGADLVQIDSGLVFSGPGLPKRINEALLFRSLRSESDSVIAQNRIGNESWFWALLMGLSMFIGGLLALVIASTRVVLPYDEAMSGLTRDQLHAVNDRLLSFMIHDRVTLAGTMIAVGILYVALSWFGIRRGVHWAQISVIMSALTGFVSFFSFLGFGYFDAFHAFVTAVLFQFLLLTIHARLPERRAMEMPDLWNDARWKANQWGQLMFVIHGAVLIVAGLVISAIGMTTVFVPEDLEFMRTSADELYGAHPRLVPLVAHDRATFGGMLLACGTATILPAVWGFRRGQGWWWLALMLAGNIAYIATVVVHLRVGYHSLKHLLPAYGGLIWLWAGGIASFPYLVARDERLEKEWASRLTGSG